MEYLAFKALSCNSNGRLASPCRDTEWDRDEGVWHLTAREGDLECGAGIYAATWAQARGYGDQVYLVVPYLPPFNTGEKETDLILGEEGWRAAAASVVAGPWDGREPMPLDAARMIVDAYLQGYQQVTGVLLQAAGTLWASGQADAALLPALLSMDSYAVLLNCLDNMGYGPSHLCSDEMEERVLKIVRVAKAVEGNDDQVARAVWDKAMGLLSSAAVKMNFMDSPEDRALLRKRLLAHGGLAAAVSFWSVMVTSSIQASATFEGAYLDLQRFAEAYRELRRLRLPLPPEEEIQTTLGVIVDAAAGAPAKDRDALAALYPGNRRERRRFSRQLEFAHLSLLRREQARNPDTLHAAAALAGVNAALSRVPGLMHDQSARVIVQALEVDAAGIAAKKDARTRAQLLALLNGHPGARRAMEGYMLRAMTKELPWRDIDKYGENLQAVLQEFPGWRQDRRMRTDIVQIAGELGHRAAKATFEQQAAACQLVAADPELYRAFELGRVSEKLEGLYDSRTLYRYAAEVNAGFAQLLAVCAEHPELVLSADAPVHDPAVNAALRLAEAAESLGGAERTAVWRYVQSTPGAYALAYWAANCAYPAYGNPWRQAVHADQERALLHLVGLSQEVYSGALSGALKRRKEMPAAVHHYPIPGMADKLLRCAIELHDLPFVIAAGACWGISGGKEISVGQAFAEIRIARGANPDEALSPRALEGFLPPADTLRLLALWPQEHLTPDIVWAVEETRAEPSWTPYRLQGEAVMNAARWVWDHWTERGYASGVLAEAFEPAMEPMAA